MTAAIYGWPDGRGKRPSGASRLRLCVLVDPRDVLRARRAIIIQAHPSVELVTLQCMRNDPRILMSIDLDPGIASEVMERLAKAVAYGVFGSPVGRGNPSPGGARSGDARRYLTDIRPGRP